MFLTFSVKKDYFEKNKDNFLKGMEHYFNPVCYWEIDELPNQVLIGCMGKKEIYLTVFDELRKKKILACPVVGMPHHEYGEIEFWNAFYPDISKKDYKIIDDNKNQLTLLIPDYYVDFRHMLNWYAINHDEFFTL
jgi:hypothetical protein